MQIYSGFFFFRDTMGNPASLARFPLWIAWYRTTPLGRSEVPSVYSGYTFWQHGDNGVVPGITTGKVDVNFFCCDMAALLSLTGKGIAPTPAPIAGPTVEPISAQCLTNDVNVRETAGTSGVLLFTAKAGDTIRVFPEARKNANG